MDKPYSIHDLTGRDVYREILKYIDTRSLYNLNIVYDDSSDTHFIKERLNEREFNAYMKAEGLITKYILQDNFSFNTVKNIGTFDIYEILGRTYVFFDEYGFPRRIQPNDFKIFGNIPYIGGRSLSYSDVTKLIVREIRNKTLNNEYTDIFDRIYRRTLLGYDHIKGNIYMIDQTFKPMFDYMIQELKVYDVDLKAMSMGYATYHNMVLIMLSYYSITKTVPINPNLIGFELFQELDTLWTRAITFSPVFACIHLCDILYKRCTTINMDIELRIIDDIVRDTEDLDRFILYSGNTISEYYLKRLNSYKI